MGKQVSETANAIKSELTAFEERMEKCFLKMSYKKIEESIWHLRGDIKQGDVCHPELLGSEIGGI